MNRFDGMLALILSCILPVLCLGQSSSSLTPFQASISPIPASVKEQMRQYTWRPGCPVALQGLAYLKLSYYGFDHQSHQGILIVNKKLAGEVKNIFKILYDKRFPIERMEPMYKFQGNDERAMEKNNTSAFNCRAITGRPGVYSQHSYGRAIDINTQINPYVKGKLVLPKNAQKFLDRCTPYPGKIYQDGVAYNAFIQHHWAWGGSWYNLHDYQHFEKRANHQLRNPFG